ncbi:hypothetical protein LUZ60_004673 [Juncus effusus]|nr:hypothetical protein LUZ60_004673 [Juncus effusus]
MNRVACNPDHEELEMLLGEIPKTHSNYSVQDEMHLQPNINANHHLLPAFGLPDEQLLSNAFSDLSFRDSSLGARPTSSSSSRANFQNPSFGVNNGDPYHNALFEGSRLQNHSMYFGNVPVPVDSAVSRRWSDLPVPVPGHLMNQSGMAWRDVEAEMYSRNLLHLQNARQTGLSSPDMYWRSTPNIMSGYPYGYNSEMLIGRGEPCRVQYGEKFRKPILKSSFSERVATRPSAQKIYDLAKDQNGCLFLQNVLKEGSLCDIEKVFCEVIHHIVDLMNDPFGNYLVQMLLERCNDDQKNRLIFEITRVPGQLISIACDMHGTRAVQKVIEVIKKSPHLISRVISALNPGVLDLMVDANGSHVAQRCLQHMDPEQTMFILDTALKHCFELAKNRQGCCVLQKCIHHSTEDIKYQLVHSVTSNTLILSEDPYGNYVIQYIIEMKVPWMTNRIVNQLDGRFGALSMQKYSSNVVEKCLKLGGEANRARIIHELIVSSEELLDISLDQFGNYVIQSAITSSRGSLRAALVEAIKPHIAALRNSSYGRRVLAKMGMKSK